MKTLKKVLCVILSILMAMSCLSAVALAADGEKFTSTLKAHTSINDTQSAKVTLDMVDAALKEANVCERVVLIEKTLLTDAVEIVIDLRSITALCGTIDDYVGIIKAVVAADITGAILGDIKNLNLKTWKKGLKRSGDDITIMKEFLELADANRDLVKKICDGSINLGIFKDYVDVSTMLGPDGVSGALKEALIGSVYGSDTPEFSTAYNKYKNDMDAFIYDEFIPAFTNELLPGLDLNAASTINELLIDVYNISFEKYIKPTISTLKISFADSTYEEFKKLDSVINFDGSTYNLDGLTYIKDGTPIPDQVNRILGNYMKNAVPGFTKWNFKDGYSALKSNIEGSIKYVAEKSGIVKNAQSKTVEQIGVEIALIILLNGNAGPYSEGLESCTSLEEIASRFLINASKEMKLGVNYNGDESYLVVLGDMLAAAAYDSIPFTDADGKTYLPGGGKDFFEVANYILNYFLLDRPGAEALGLSTSRSDDFFTKLDKLADYFGNNKAVNFNSRSFILGTSDKKGVLDCLFTLDLVGLLDITAIPALNKAGNVPVVEFLYRTVQYFANNWAGKTLFPAYQSKAFTNALSNSNIANMISVLLETLENRKSAIVSLLTFSLSLMLEGGKTTDYAIESATVSDIVATGKTLFPSATVKAGGKTLTQNKDYVVVTKSLEPGAATATIKGIGLYSGEITRSFNIKMDSVSSVSYTSNASSVTLSWEKVPFADSYNVSKYNTKTKKYETLKSGVTTASYTVTGLSPSSEYKFSVQAADKTVGTTAAKEITAYTAPSAVTASGVKSTPTTSSIKLTWSKVTGATHYIIEQSAGSNKWTKLTETDALNYTVSKLSAATEYTFRITAIKKLADGRILTAVATTVKAKTQLATPTSIKATSAETSITLSWAKVNNATSYVVKRLNGSKWETVATVSGTTATVSKLSSGSEYQFSIQATSSSYTASAEGKITAYTLPSAVTASGVKSTPTTSSIKLAWSKVTGATHYIIEQSAGSSKWTKLAETDALNYTVSKLSAGTEYTFRITAIKKLADGTKLTAAATTVKAKTQLATPSSIKATYAVNSITLSWAKVNNATSYTVKRLNGSKWETVATVTGTSATVSKLSSGGEYQFSIQATSSSYTASAEGKITAYTLPSAVTASGVKSTPTTSSIKLTWSKVTGATEYKIEQYASKKWKTVATVTGTSATVSKLSAGTEYTFRITAVKKLTDGKKLNAATTTIKAKTQLAAPASVKATASATSVALSWAKVKSAEKYVVEQYTNGKWKAIKTLAGTSHTVKKLTQSTEYKFRIKATGGTYKDSAYTSVTTTTLPDTVKSSGIKTSVTASSVKLTWKKATGATHYKVEQYISKKWKTVATVTGTSATVKDLVGYTEYSFRITALKETGKNKYIASPAVTVKAKTKLGTTSSLTASYTDTSITLKWAKVKNAQKYEVLMYTGGKWKKLATVTGTSYTASKLKATTSYKLAVRALVVEGKKNVYGDRKEITQYTGLKKATGLKASSITATSAKITWSKVSKATSYEVYAYIGGKWVKKGSTKNTSLTVKGLPSGQKTKIRVRAAAKLGGKTIYGTYSENLSVLTVVGKVTGVKASVRKTSSITLTWTKTTGATSYEVYRLVGGKWKKLGTTTKTTFTDSKSLKRNTEYKYQVRAVQKVDKKTVRYGEYSAQLKAKTTLVGTAK